MQFCILAAKRDDITAAFNSNLGGNTVFDGAILDFDEIKLTAMLPQLSMARR